MTINELREKRNQAWEAAKAFVETKRDKDGLLSDEDAKTYAQMEKKVQDFGAEIERMEAMAAMDAQLSNPSPKFQYMVTVMKWNPAIMRMDIPPGTSGQIQIILQIIFTKITSYLSRRRLLCRDKGGKRLMR